MARQHVDMLKQALEAAGLPTETFAQRTFAKAKTPRVNLFKDHMLLPVGTRGTWLKVSAYNNGASLDLARYESTPDNDPSNHEDHWAERKYGLAINEAEFLDLLENAEQIKERIALAKATVAQDGVNKKDHMSKLVAQSTKARAANFEAVRQRYLLTASQEQPAAKRQAPQTSAPPPSRYLESYGLA